MTKRGIIPDTDEAWDSGELGRELESAERSEDGPELEAMIDEAIGLQPISIRLEKSLVEDFKFIATINGIGYQPLMRQILKRFADSEKKRILREVAADVQAKAAAEVAKPKSRKAA